MFDLAARFVVVYILVSTLFALLVYFRLRPVTSCPLSYLLISVKFFLAFWQTVFFLFWGPTAADK